jgi:GNAT superfamily N-acetyltransferase
MYRKDSRYLGFLPRGAFEDHAEKRQLMLALAPDDICVGYLLFRVARGKATIVHLCVTDTHRGKGVARKLVERLIAETKELLGIGLFCRRDYAVNKMWPRFHFVARGSKRGRGHDNAELTYWWLDHNSPDLFSLADEASNDDRLSVVIDANVFFDLYGRNSAESEDSKALLADWLQDRIQLCLTDEIYNDINRSTDETTRGRNKANTTKLKLLRTRPADVQAITQQLATILPSPKNSRDESDIRHLAYTIAAKEQFFATRDEKLIDRAEPLYLKFGLLVLGPASLINRLDSLARERDYRPIRLGGTNIRHGLLRAEMIVEVSEAFRTQGEKRSDLEKQLSHFLARPQEFRSQFSSTATGKHLVLLVVKSDGPDHSEIAALRATDDPMAPTVVRHVLRSLIETTGNASPAVLSVSESNLAPAVVAAFQEFGFGYGEGRWIKILGRGVQRTDDLRTLAGRCLSASSALGLAQQVSKALDTYVNSPHVVAAAQLEHLFWPAKLEAASIPTYIIPIQPRWALHFFDDELGSQILFGLRSELNLGIEGVYYRSPRGPVITAPGRILWYVSQGQSHDGAMAIKACSRLEEVAVGPAKELFKRFRRLGVYEWRDLAASESRNPGGKIMALRFTLTERFKTPVRLDWLNDHGIKGNFPGPRAIPPEQFEIIYREGFKLH